MILSQGDSRGWFVSVCKLTLLCTGLWSPTCEFTSQSKIICLLLFMFWNPAYFDVVAFLLQGHAEQSIVLTHHLVVFELICWNWSTISSYSLLADTCCSFCSREVFKPDQTNYWNLLKWIFFCLKWGIKWNSFYPILHSASRKKFVTTETLGPILSPSAFSQVAPVTCHYIKYCSACTGMTESDPSCLWLLVIQKCLGWGVGNRLLM